MTRKLLVEVMKSMFPEKPVAITGFSRLMASAMVIPKPSERCSDT